MIRKLLLICLVWCASPSPYLEAQVRYDLAFKHSGEMHFPWMDWRWWKAQGISESNLNQAARGSRGEIGIMQLMPSLARALGVDPYDPESNIEGGIRYDRQLWDAWPDAADRRELMFASYNAGIGNVKRAAKAAASTTWALVAHSLAAVTAANAPITVNYVAGIGRLMGTR